MKGEKGTNSDGLMVVYRLAGINALVQKNSVLQFIYCASIYHSVDIPTPFLQEGRSKFWLPSMEEGIWKINKSGWKYGAGAVLLKRREWHFSNLIFSRFIIFTFRNYFTLCKIVLCIWRKITFFCHHNFMQNGHSKLSKNEPGNIP